MNSALKQISIIIPTFNEAQTITCLLRSLARQQRINDAEVIIVDGGSEDATRDNVAGFPFARVIQAERGLMKQLDAGAKAASAPVLWFLHADSTIPRQSSIDAILELLQDSNVLGGCFEFRLRGDDLFYAVISFLVNMRTRLFNRVYGDQGIFCHRDAYMAVGGLLSGHACEDADLYIRLSKKGQMRLLHHTVETSARTWQHYGKWHTLTYHLREWLSFECSRGNKL